MTTVTVFRRVPPPIIGVCGVVPDRAFATFEDALHPASLTSRRQTTTGKRRPASSSSSPSTPPALKGVLFEIASRLRPDAVVVSLAPVLSLARLSALLGGFTRLAPDAASIVRAGLNPAAFAEGLPAEARAEVEAFLGGSGRIPSSQRARRKPTRP